VEWVTFCFLLLEIPDSNLGSKTDILTEGFAVFFLHWLYSPFGPWLLIFSFIIILQTVGFLGRVMSSSQGLYLNTGQHKHRINTYIYQISMPCVGFEPTIPASEQAKTVHILDRLATVTGSFSSVTPRKYDSASN
jgi:hypothetical protein